jgi:hypothetical protein
MMNSSKLTRLARLEEKQSKIEKAKDYCPCYCHNEVPEWLTVEHLEGAFEILKTIEMRDEDGKITNAYEVTMKRKAEIEPCNCNH